MREVRAHRKLWVGAAVALLSVAAMFGRFSVGPIGDFGALGIAFLIAVMTAVTSRMTVYGYLAETD